MSPYHVIIAWIPSTPNQSHDYNLAGQLTILESDGAIEIREEDHGRVGLHEGKVRGRHIAMSTMY